MANPYLDDALKRLANALADLLTGATQLHIDKDTTGDKTIYVKR